VVEFFLSNTLRGAMAGGCSKSFRCVMVVGGAEIDGEQTEKTDVES